MGDALVGITLLAATSGVFLYYTLWVIVLPFVDVDQTYIHSLFPDPALAVSLPLLAGVVGLTAIGTFVAVVILRSKEKVE